MILKTKKLAVILLVGLVAAIGATAYRDGVLARRRQTEAAARPPAATVSASHAAAMWNATETQLRAAATAHPEDREAHWALANFYGETGQSQQAIPQLDIITRLGPRSTAERLTLANLRLLLNQYAQAQTMYRSVIAVEPRNEQAWQGLAAALSEQQHFFEAMQAAQRAVQIEPDNAGGRLLLASVTLQHAEQFSNSAAQHQELALARGEFRRLTVMMPENADVYVRLGTACLMLQDWNDALAALHHALTLTSRPDLYVQLARAERGASDATAALDTVAQGLSRYPQDADLHDLRGQFLQSSPQPDAATQTLKEFQAALSLQPTNEIYLEHTGAALVRAGRLAEARAVLENATRLAPNRAFPIQQLAVIYTRLGDVPRARQADLTAKALVSNSRQLDQIQLLSAVHPNSVALNLILADRYRALGKPGSARDEYLLVLHLDPNNAHALQGLAALKESSQ